MANTDQKEQIKAVLTQIYGEHVNRLFKLTGSEVLIGRNPKSHVKLECPNVSRKHCILTYNDDCWKIRDNKSQNGTYVNGLKLHDGETHLLQCGDLVFLGPPAELPQAFSYDDGMDCDIELMEYNEEEICRLSAKRASVEVVEISSKKRNLDKEASEVTDKKSNKNFFSSSNAGTISGISTKAKYECKLSNRKHKRTENLHSESKKAISVSFKSCLDSKHKSTKNDGQINEISSTGDNQFENSESLLDVGNESLNDPFVLENADESIQLYTSKQCNSQNTQSFQNSKESKLMQSELASLSEQIKKLEDSKLELLKNYEDVCEKNKSLDQQLAEQKKLRDNIKIHELKARNEVKSQLLEKFEEDLVCNICTELFIKPTVLDCSHTFCEYCIKEWKKKKNDCPICRCRIKNMTQIRTLEQFIDKSLQTLTPEQRERRHQLIVERFITEVPQNKAPTPTSRRRHGRRYRTVRISNNNIRILNNNNPVTEERRILPLDLSPLFPGRNLNFVSEVFLSDNENDS